MCSPPNKPMEPAALGARRLIGMAFGGRPRESGHEFTE
jgi:hypothetical protein